MPSTDPDPRPQTRTAARFGAQFRAEIAALQLADDDLATAVADRVAKRADRLLAGHGSDPDLDPDLAAQVVVAVLSETIDLTEEPPAATRSVDRMSARQLLAEVLRRRPGGSRRSAPGGAR